MFLIKRFNVLCRLVITIYIEVAYIKRKCSMLICLRSCEKSDLVNEEIFNNSPFCTLYTEVDVVHLTSNQPPSNFTKKCCVIFSYSFLNSLIILGVKALKQDHKTTTVNV